MKKYFLNIVALNSILVFNTTYSQTQPARTLPSDETTAYSQTQPARTLPSDETAAKVLINPNDTYRAPERTLDVNGGVRLATPGRFSESVLPLGIKHDTKQVVLYDIVNNPSPLFEQRRYKFKVEDRAYGEKVWNKDLGINPREYSIVVLGVSLTREATKEENGQTYTYTIAATPSLQTISDTWVGNDGAWANGLGELVAKNGYFGVIGRNNGGRVYVQQDEDDGNYNKGAITVFSGQNNLYSKSSRGAYNANQYNFLFYPIQKVHITSDGSTYRFFADLRDSEDSFYNAKNHWVLDILLVKNIMMSNNPTQTIQGNVKYNSDGTHTLEKVRGEYLN